jgi:hypothetical protein
MALGNLSLSIAILDVNLRGPTATLDEQGLNAVRSAWEDVKAELNRRPSPEGGGGEDGRPEPARTLAGPQQPRSRPEVGPSGAWTPFSLADERFLDPGVEVLVRFRVLCGARNDYRGLYYIIGDDPLEDPTEGPPSSQRVPILTKRIVATRREAYAER